MQGIDNLNTERAGLLTQEEAKLCLSFGVCTTKCECARIIRRAKTS